jgi:magnesium transporter
MSTETSQTPQSETVLDEVRRLLGGDDINRALILLADLHAADQAEALAVLEPDDCALLLQQFERESIAQVLEYLEEEPRRAIIERIDPAVLGPVLDEADQDVAVDVLHGLSPERSRAVLAAMHTSAEIAPLLPYGDETAGGRMTSDFVALHKEWTVDEALSYLRRTRPDAEQAFYLYVVDDSHRLQGVVSLRELVVAEPDVRIAGIMTPDVVRVDANEDQEELARRIQHYRFVALPVVDTDKRLIGVVGVDDLVAVVEEEATEDMYQMVGLDTEETVFSPVARAARRRIPWLLVNLAIAFLAAMTVRAFEDTISQVAVLAVFMPVVAGHGGNMGTQTITLVVRALALGEVRPADAWPVIWRQVGVGLIHGLIVGLLSAGLAYIITDGNGWLAMIVFVAMLANVIIAAAVGSLLPLLMRRIGIDPALASSIWLTTFTDVMGFILLLGLGTLLIDEIS